MAGIQVIKWGRFPIGIRNKKTKRWLITSYGDNAELQEWTPKQVMRDGSPANLDFIDAQEKGLNLTEKQMRSRLKLKKVM